VSTETLDVRRLRRNPSIDEAPLQNEMMLFDAATSKFFVLNPAMAVTWRLCDGAHSIGDISTELASRFDGVTAEQASADAQSAVDELRKLGLLLDAE